MREAWDLIWGFLKILVDQNVDLLLLSKINYKVNGWTARWLSKGGNEVLINPIALTLPTHVISTFLLPLETCENLASAISQFM